MTDPTLPASLVAHAEFVRRLAWHLVRTDAEADDVAQETFARALARPPRNPSEPRPWLAGVVRNVVRRFRRDAVRRDRREGVAARPEAVVGPDEIAARAEVLRAVAAAVDALDEPYKAVVLLRHYDGLPPREIALRLGVPVETVHTRLQRAHTRLRERLDGGAGTVGRGWRATMLAFLLADASRYAGPAGAAGAGSTALAATVLGKGLVVGGVIAVLAIAGFLLARPEKSPDREAAQSGPPSLAQAAPEAPAKAPSLVAAPPRQKAGGTHSPATPGDPIGEIAGLCVEENDAPIEGATVYLVPKGSPGIDKLQGPHAKTDGRGRFTLADAMRAGQWICAIKDGYMPAHVDGDASADPRTIRLVMEAGREVVVEISSSGPQGLPAHVWLVPDQPMEGKAVRFPSPEQPWQTEAQAVTPEGSVTLRIGTREAVMVGASPNHSWWLSEPHQVRLTAAEARAAFRLVPSGIMRIRVLREDGRPFEGPFQTARLPADRDEVLSGSSTTNPDRTGALDDGYGIPPGTYRLRVFADGYAPWTSGPLTFARPGDSLEVRATLVPDFARRPGTLVLSIPAADVTGTSWYREPTSPGRGAPGILVRPAGGEWFSPSGVGLVPSGEMHSYESKWNEAARTLRVGLPAATYDVLVWDRSTWTCGFARELSLTADGVATARIPLVPGVRIRIEDLVGKGGTAKGLRIRADGVDDLPASENMTPGSAQSFGPSDTVPADVVLSPLPFDVLHVTWKDADGTPHEKDVRSPDPK